METGGTTPAGSGRTLRLDPFSLPARFAARDPGADGQVRTVELHHERVVLRRSVRGMRMAIGIPVDAYRGVTLRLLPPQDAHEAAVSITLEHNDPALSVPLMLSTDCNEVTSAWKTWSRVLDLPLLVGASEGLRELLPQVGAVATRRPSPRRRRRTALRRRRPSIPMRRKPGCGMAGAAVHRGEREIVARN